MWHWTLTSPTTLTLEFLKSNFETDVPQELVWFNAMLNENEADQYWDDYVTPSFDHTHGLDLEFSRSEIEITLFQN